MSIASKPIAGCSPIASGTCYVSAMVEAAKGDCILVPPHENTTCAPAHGNYIYAGAYNDDAVAPDGENTVVVPGFQQCNREAA